MGASHTTLASTGGGGEEAIPELEGSGNSDLSAYTQDQHLFPGSGRMLRTFRLRHKKNGSTVVLKSMFVSKDHEAVVQQQEKELQRILQALKGQTHVAPFLYWSVGQYKPKPNNTMVRQISIMRPHAYTTLSDRLASRPFLTHVEKLWIVYQLLQALVAMHSKGIVHGFLTTENIGLSSWNWVILVDVASYKTRTALPDDDPTEYLYYFQENYQHGTDATPREKRCYLAPERFYTPNLDTQHQEGEERPQPPLTPAMDIFSAGCVMMETFLNGERALDLGDLMEYRKQKSSQTLQQKLNKIEFSAMRAACRHMLHLDPTERLSASAYLDRLQASALVPKSFVTMASMMERVTYVAPDARLALAAAYYSRILWESLGVDDVDGKQYVENVLGTTMHRSEHVAQELVDPEIDGVESQDQVRSGAEQDNNISNADLFAETEALLKKLEALNFDEDTVMGIATNEASSTTPVGRPNIENVERSEISQSSLLIYLQLILSTVSHVQRPSSKLVALQLIERVGRFSSDEARLQRIVPVTVSLLQDQDPLVRASAIQVLASTVSTIDSFPPSDSKIFPEYIFKRVAHLITDPSLVVRLVFSRSVAILAETSQRFLDISHAVRLYEAVGGGGGSSASQENAKEAHSLTGNVFTDDVAKLLDESSITKEKSEIQRDESGTETPASDNVHGAGKTLIRSTYAAELGTLHETVSRWVVHITTDQSEQSSPVKRAFLDDMARLCNFFGLDGVMAFILPQLLSFLNDRKDWQLRAALFDCLPSVCHIIGRAATEHFVLPCLETALVDGEEPVISRALRCLSQLLSMGLISQSLLLDTPSSVEISESTPGLLKKYGALLLHPSADVRFFAIATVNAFSQFLGHPDAEVFVVPILRPFLRFSPTIRHLTTREGLEGCLQPPWTRTRFQQELDKLQAANNVSMSPTSEPWTSIALQVQEGSNHTQLDGNKASKVGNQKEGNSAREIDAQAEQVRLYLRLLARSRTYHMKAQTGDTTLRTHLNQCIEGSLKLSQQIKFPRQNIPGLPVTSLPDWYRTIRETQESRTGQVSESVAIRSVSALGQVYGLSIMDQNSSTGTAADVVTSQHPANVLESQESKVIEAACTGEWGSETCLDPALTDTSLLVTKLNALQVPPLPPRLAAEKAPVLKGNPATTRGGAKDQKPNGPEWKLKIDTMVASSKSTPEHGHSAPIVRLVVSQDQRFFTTASHDGTCRVWELEKAEKSNGILESSLVYSGHKHQNGQSPKINDLAMVEGGHSVISGASDGSVHVWRVDMVPSAKSAGAGQIESREVSRVVGTSEIRKMNPEEGEVLAVNQFNTSSASILSFATQKGYVHSWDLRSAREPFLLKTPQDTGYITSMTMGSDRNWVVTGSSKGFISLWDLRFQQILKLWHHSRCAPVNRLATSFVPPPQSWVGRGNTNSEARPFLFAACGPNECAMFDLSTGSCRECFRTVEYGNRFSSRARLDEMPLLEEVPLSLTARRNYILSRGINSSLRDGVASSLRSINAMVGSIGASDHSFLITGGSDCRIRFWDFAMPSKCYVSTGPETVQPRPSFERIDYDQSSRLMLCRQPPTPVLNEVDSSKVPQKLLQGTKRAEKVHEDAITDLKVVKSGLLSCSRDCTVKLWR